MNSSTKALLLIESQKKSGLFAALLNMLIPGVGYMYCGRILLGIFAGFITICLSILTMGIAYPFMITLLLIDGFLCAGRHNRKLVMDALVASARE